MLLLILLYNSLLRIKEKEKEEKRKAVIQAQEYASSNTSVPTGTVQNDLGKPNDKLINDKSWKAKIFAGSPTIFSNPSKMAELGTPRSSCGIPKVLTTNSPPLKQPQSPTTNIQIRIEPSKKPEIVFTDVAPQVSETATKQSSDSALDVGARESSKETNEVPKSGVANTVNTSVAATHQNTLKGSSIAVQGKIVTASDPKLQEIGGNTSGNNNEGSTKK